MKLPESKVHRRELSWCRLTGSMRWIGGTLVILDGRLQNRNCHSCSSEEGEERMVRKRLQLERTSFGNVRGG